MVYRSYCDVYWTFIKSQKFAENSSFRERFRMYWREYFHYRETNFSCLPWEMRYTSRNGKWKAITKQTAIKTVSSPVDSWAFGNGEKSVLVLIHLNLLKFLPLMEEKGFIATGEKLSVSFQCKWSLFWAEKKEEKVFFRERISKFTSCFTNQLLGVNWLIHKTTFSNYNSTIIIRNNFYTLCCLRKEILVI